MNERFRELVEQAPDGVVILDRGRITFINTTAARLLGATPEAALGTPITSYLPPADAAATAERIARMLATGEPTTANEYSTLADPTRVVEIKSIPWQWDGRPAVLAFARDVTERKALQQQVLRADRLAAVGTLAAGVAHEINNPLQFMVMNLELIEQALETTPGAREAFGESLQDLAHGVDRITSVTRTLRGFARADDLAPGPVDLVAVVERALAMVDHDLRHRARLVRELGDARWVLANASRLEQVVVNLLINAIHASRGEPGDTITVSIRPSEPAGVCLEVRDTGPGMSSSVLEHAFDPFYTTRPAGDGLGLGLFVSKSIVDAAGGEIALTSVEGRGTTASVTLRAHAGAPSPSPATPEQVRGRARRLLVIDDEPRVREALQRLLGRFHDVTVADGGETALARIRERTFDVILCDVMMPGLNGADVYRRIAQVWPGLERRIVFASGGSFVPELREFVTGTGNRVIDKPFELAQVLDAIAAVAE